MRPPATLAFNLHGRVVRIEGASPALASAIGERLAWAPDAGDAAADIDIRYAPFPLSGLAGGRTVYESPLATARYDEDGDLLSVAGDGIALRGRCGEGVVEIAVDEGIDRAVWIASRPLLTLALTEALKRRGLFPVHAGAAVSEGRAIVIPGPTGAGKSTLSLALARAGLGFMSDDLVLVEPGTGGPRVLGFPEQADATPKTAGFFPELAQVAAQGVRPGWQKLAVDVQHSFGAAIATGAAPGLIVFPRIADSPESSLEPVSLASALVRLGPDVLLTAHEASQRHLDALAELVEASACYGLAMGLDVTDAARLVVEAAGLD